MQARLLMGERRILSLNEHDACRAAIPCRLKDALEHGNKLQSFLISSLSLSPVLCGKYPPNENKKVEKIKRKK